MTREQREIKFRAWYPNRRDKMAYFDIESAVRKSRHLQPHDFEGLFDYEALMQFTGLLDKNGKEIYEGDILEYTKWMNRSEIDTEYGLTIVKRNQENCEYDGLNAGVSVWRTPIVIGNIYENPELLETTK